MYFIELLVKYLKKDRVEDLIEKYESEKSINPLDAMFETDEDDNANCEHIFMPIDSSGETFACSKCGLVIDKKTYERRNIFKDK